MKKKERHHLHLLEYHWLEMHEIPPGATAEWARSTEFVILCRELDVMESPMGTGLFSLLLIQHCMARVLMKDEEPVFLVLTLSDWEDVGEKQCETMERTLLDLRLPRRKRKSPSQKSSMKERKGISKKQDAVKVRQRKVVEVETLAVIEGADAHLVPLARDHPRFFGRVPPSSEAQ